MNLASPSPGESSARHAASPDTAVLVAAFAVWVVSAVRVLGTFARHEAFGAESTLALVMVLWMTRVLVTPWTARRPPSQ